MKPIVLILTLVLGSSVMGMSLDTSCMDADFLTSQPPEADKAAVTRGERDFSVNLMKSLFYGFNATGNNGNIFISPSSIYQTLMLSYFGAAGKTETELAKVLGLGDLDKDAVKRAYLFERAYQEIREKNPDLGYELTHVNKFYFDRELPLSSCMQLLLQNELEPVDFGNPEKTRKSINRWVEEQTRKKIKDLIPEGSFDPTTSVALVNAAYFKGQWKSQFNIEDTKRDNFYLRRDKITTTKFMKQKGNFHYYTSEELRAHVLQLPYQGDDISMLVILPPFEDDSLYTTVQKLTPETLQLVLAEVRSGFYEVEDLNVELPKFSVEQNFDLANTLSKLGLNSLFGETDLREFFDKEFRDAEASKIKLNSALHKSFIEVNEEGSEAAAATALFGFRSARPLFHTHFIANHPFLFLIVDEKTDLVLFFGVYQNPKK